jgi:dienelactone hydrolase
VPAVLWRPPGVEQPPVVLLAHGGSGHKRNARTVERATRFARAGIATLAIDGPFHGDRAVPGDGRFGYQQRILDAGARVVHERMRDDWLAALDHVAAPGWVDGSRVGFVGLSMGARYGVAACAALGHRLRVAVLGKFGLVQSPDLPTGLAADDIVREAAERITAPVLVHVQTGDEVFPVDGQLALFEALASPDKQLRARPGGHTGSNGDDELAWHRFVLAHLSGPPVAYGPGRPDNSG